MDISLRSFRGRARADQDPDGSHAATERTAESIREADGNHSLSDTGSYVSGEPDAGSYSGEGKSESHGDHSDKSDSRDHDCVAHSDRCGTRECDAFSLATNTSATHPECDAWCRCGEPHPGGYASDGCHGHARSLRDGSSASVADDSETESIDCAGGNCPRRDTNSRGCDYTRGPHPAITTGFVRRHSHADREAVTSACRDASDSAKNAAAAQHARTHGTAFERHGKRIEAIADLASGEAPERTAAHRLANAVAPSHRDQ